MYVEVQHFFIITVEIIKNEPLNAYLQFISIKKETIFKHILFK